MQRMISLLLCLMMVLCAAGCNGSGANLETPAGTSLSTPAPTIQPTPPPTTVPPTTVPSTPAPTIGPTCPPVEGDQYWGEFRGKGFKNPNGLGAPIRSIVLYSDGTCVCQLSIYSSFWDPTTVWTFDGEYLYIGPVESGEYSTLLYVGAEDPNESKLIFIKSDHDLYHFERLPDGQEFIFGGIIRYNTQSEETVPPATEPEQTVPPATEHEQIVPPATKPTTRPTRTPVEGDTQWGLHDGKSFICEIAEVKFIIELFTDGTFTLRSTQNSDYEDHGIWNLEGNRLSLIGWDESSNENGYVSIFQYIPEEHCLVFNKGNRDLPNMNSCADNSVFELGYFLAFPKY